MATFRFGVNNRPSKNKTYVVFLCVTVDGQRKHIKTPIEVKRRSDFNSRARQNNWIKPAEPNYKAWNIALAAELENARKKYRDLRESGIASSERVASEIIAGERSTSFLQYAKDRTQEIYNAGGFRNWKKYNGFVNKLEGFLTGKDGRVRDLTFGELTPGLLSKFEAYMHTLKNEREPEKKLHPNTIKVNFTIFKSIVNRAIEVDGHIKPEKNPFLGYTYKGVPTAKEKLNLDEIQLIEGLELEPGSMLWHVRNYFLFSFYCAGIRAGDLIQLRWCNITSEGRLRYQMGKNHKPSDFVIVAQAKEILAHYRQEDSKQTDYIFPLLDSSASYAAAITQEDKDHPNLRQNHRPEDKPRHGNLVAQVGRYGEEYLPSHLIKNRIPMKEERNIITMDEQGNIFLPSDIGAIAMTEWEICELFGVIAPTVRAGIKALCKSGVLSIYDIKRIICISDRYSIEVYNLETIATLAFRIESFGAAKVRKVLLERIMHGRKEKTTVFVSVVSDGKPNSRWKA